MNPKKLNPSTIKFLLICLVSFLLGITLGILSSSKDESVKKINTSTIETSIQPTTFTIKKGDVYIRHSFVDVDDPFNVPIIDTITVLDLQTSKNSPDLIYVKWTFNNWHDTSRYISTELSIFSKGLEEIK